MAPIGYCTLDDVRRALRKKGLPGDVSQEEEIALDAIYAETEPLEKRLKRHWYEPTDIDGATNVEIPTSAKNRDDEHDIQTSGGFVHGDSERDGIERLAYDSVNNDSHGDHDAPTGCHHTQRHGVADGRSGRNCPQRHPRRGSRHGTDLWRDAVRLDDLRDASGRE